MPGSRISNDVFVNGEIIPAAFVVADNSDSLAPWNPIRQDDDRGHYLLRFFFGFLGTHFRVFAVLRIGMES